MMNEFWTTLLNSPVIATVVETILLCGLVLWLQHIYNKKLEQHKEQVQKKIDEHQIQFKYWHEEKSKAIKEFYYSAVLLYQEMKDYHIISKRFATNMTVGIQSDLEERMNRILQSNNASYRNWTCLRLFLKNEELLVSDSFFSKGHSIFKSLSSQYKQKDYTIDSQKIERELDEILTLIEELRKKLQDILKAHEAK